MEKKHVEYIPVGGVCSRMIIVDVENGIIKKVQIVGGCQGNTTGLSVLLENMEVGEAIRRLDGIDCKGRGTSCPDQVAKALRQFTV